MRQIPLCACGESVKVRFRTIDKSKVEHLFVHVCNLVVRVYCELITKTRFSFQSPQNVEIKSSFVTAGAKKVEMYFD